MLVLVCREFAAPYFKGVYVNCLMVTPQFGALRDTQNCVEWDGDDEEAPLRASTLEQLCAIAVAMLAIRMSIGVFITPPLCHISKSLASTQGLWRVNFA